MDDIIWKFEHIVEVEHNIKPDGTLTALCRLCCEQNIRHGFDLFTSSPKYDIISFRYWLTTTKGDEVSNILNWLEEKTMKEDFHGSQELCGSEADL